MRNNPKIDTIKCNDIAIKSKSRSILNINGGPSSIRSSTLVAALAAAGITATAAALASSCALERQGLGLTQPNNGEDAGVPDANPGGNGGEAGVAGQGGWPTGGAAGQGGSAGEGGIAGAGGEAGNAGNGGEAGAGGAGGGCNGIELTLSNMAEYEYKLYRTDCAGLVESTSLANGNFEFGDNKFCLQPGFDYRGVFQVKDAADMNAIEFSAPQGSVTAAKVTTLVTTQPIDDGTANLLCNASAGWTDLNPIADDLNPVANENKYNGNTEGGDAGLPNSNAFLVDWSL